MVDEIDVRRGYMIFADCFGFDNSLAGAGTSWRR